MPAEPSCQSLVASYERFCALGHHRSPSWMKLYLSVQPYGVLLMLSDLSLFLAFALYVSLRFNIFIFICVPECFARMCVGAA